MNHQVALSLRETTDHIKWSRTFCNLMETQDHSTHLLTAIQKLLSQLYSSALLLPRIEVVYNLEFEPEIDNETKAKIKDQLIKSTDPDQFYWTIFNPIVDRNTSDNVVCGDLIDDLLDIYSDIKRTLIILDKKTDESTEEALWNMHFYFWYHWGCHATDAIKAIHAILEKKLN